MTENSTTIQRPITTKRLAASLMGAGALLLSACSGGSGEGGSAIFMDLTEISGGFGQLVPHTVRELDPFGNPTGNVISIRTQADLINNVRALNPVRRTPAYPVQAILADGSPGNHFLYATFTQDLDIDTVLRGDALGAGTNGLGLGISAVGIDPISGQVSNLSGKAFVGGTTYGGVLTNGLLELQSWVRFDSDTGLIVPLDVNGETPGLGFPGSESVVDGAAAFASPRSLFFVADTDNDLSTHETFPTGLQLQMRVETSVRASQAAGGESMGRTAVGSSTVGTDTILPAVKVRPGTNNPEIIPGNGEELIDTATNIKVQFTEPVQPLSLGSLPTGTVPPASATILVQFGPPASRITVPFTVMPKSVFDLTQYMLEPVFDFPGQGPPSASCTLFSRVDVTVNTGMFSDLANVPNANGVGAQTFFSTDDGAGIVNAPVAPDTIYIGRTFQGDPAISVIDLNGFGQSTGNPLVETEPNGAIVKGSSNFPNNPNVLIQGGSLIPPLQNGTCTFNGGSAGVFTLVRDSSLSDLLVRPPTLTSVGDMMLGNALDVAFNNGPAPFGCQSAGGGNICALDGLKQPNPVIFGNTMAPQAANQNSAAPPGSPNLISWAPHPNPPALAFPPLCVAPEIGGQEPTSTDTAVANLLLPGNPTGAPLSGIPPSGLLTPELNFYFVGPSPPQQNVSTCTAYQYRQQVGHFLYVIDRGQRQVVVLNSNRMTVIDRITLPDPTDLAMSPNLDLLAVTNQTADLVTFIDIDPRSATFHQIVQQTTVGARPRGIAWELGNEDILVCNEDDNTVSIIAAANLQVRKVIQSNLSSPFDIATTPRQANFGFLRNVYFAWIMNRNGRVAIFESGPNTVNGWGFDDVIGISPQTFRNPKAIQPDHINIQGGVWIAHEGPINIATNESGAFGEGAVSNLWIQSALVGALPLNFTSLLIPQFRDLSLGVRASVGEDQLSGIPTDLAFDNLRNIAGLPNYTTAFSAGAPTPINGKNIVRQVGPVVVNCNEPLNMYLAIPNPTAGSGVIDVVDMNSNRRIDTDPYIQGIQSIPADGAQFVMDYFRQ